MFRYFHFEEVFNSIRQHKTRNILSGLGIAWGIFILVLLLGAGDGLQKGIFQLFGNFSKNSVWVVGGQSSKVDIGKTEGKRIIFNEEILNILKYRFDDYITEVSPEVTLNKLTNVSYKNHFNNYTIKGITEDYFKIKILSASQGRLFNYLDNKEERRNVVIGENVKKVLFEEGNPIGKKINISENWFTVIGVLESGSIFNQQDQNSIYIPYHTCKSYLNHGSEFSIIMFNLASTVKSIDFELKLKKCLARYLDFDYEDKKALRTINFDEQAKSFNKLFNGLNYFFWFIGICLLLVGIVGVGNISLVIVKERTKEIGIRKSLGARSNDIIGMILSESILITVFSGLVGLFLGYLVLFLINLVLENKMDEGFLIAKMEFNILASVVATIILMISGLIAGLIPAKNAAKINPIEAIRQE